MKKGASQASGLKSGYCVGRLRQRDSPPSHLSPFMEGYPHPSGFAIDGHHNFGFAGRQINRFNWDRKIVGDLRKRDAQSCGAEFQRHEC